MRVGKGMGNEWKRWLSDDIEMDGVWMNFDGGNIEMGAIDT